MKATIKNGSKGPEGVWTASGLRYIAPGSQLTAEFDAGSLARLKRLGFLSIEEKGEPAPTPEPETEADPLDAMTVVELRKMAADDEIDLQGATLKADIVAAIQLAREAQG